MYIHLYIYIQLYTYGGFRIWRYPNSWMVYFMENPKQEWMMTGGTPISGNLHMGLTWFNHPNLTFDNQQQWCTATVQGIFFEETLIFNERTQ